MRVGGKGGIRGRIRVGRRCCKRWIRSLRRERRRRVESLPKVSTLQDQYCCIPSRCQIVLCNSFRLPCHMLILLAVILAHQRLAVTEAWISAALLKQTWHGMKRIGGVHTNCWQVNYKEIDHFEDVDIDGRSFEKDLKEIVRQSVDWIHLAQDGNKWRVLVNTVMNIGFSKMLWISLLAQQQSASKEQCSFPQAPPRS
jgi:hypothetical protein